MQISVVANELATLEVPLLSILVFEEQVSEQPELRALDQKLDGLIFRLVEEEQFKGKKGQTLSLHSLGRLGPARLLLVGGGKRGDFRPAELRGYAARTVKAAHAVHAATAAAALPALELPGLTAERLGALFAEGALLGGYRFDKYLTGDKKKPLAVGEVRLVVEPSASGRVAALKKGVERGVTLAAGVSRARDLINEPAGFLTPTKMAEEAERIAKERGLAVEIFGPRECQALGMGMYLAVAQGSTEEPRFIHLSYKPAGTPKKRVVLVGKGVTFDSGGLSLKPSNAMEGMKVDMSGAAAVLGAMEVLAKLGVPYEVHALAACTENMPSGRAYKLGDVLTSMAGKTVEINNTDAEGRLTLGDAITYAVKKLHPDELFDFATLTGACVVALGPHHAGVMSNDRALQERWLAAAESAGEPMWPLPLPEELKEQLKSDVADMRNTGAREGGALTAGLFLKEFVGETPWVHVDIAGPAAADKESGHIQKGGTGFAVATIVEYLSS